VKALLKEDLESGNENKIKRSSTMLLE